MSIGMGPRALRRDLLAAAFAEVPIGMKLLGGPLGSNPSIFQMDIGQSTAFGEYVRIWPGDHDNRIEVLDMDRGYRQLLLSVEEPRRAFTQSVLRSSGTRQADVEAKLLADGGRILSQDRNGWLLRLFTPSQERHMLCGQDDLHLFIALVENTDTVAKAHAALKPSVVEEAERSWPGGIRRQGEWFFLPLTGAQHRLVLRNIRDRPRAVKALGSLGAGQKPHLADQVLRIERRRKVGRRERRNMEVYARGAVRHDDHRPVLLHQWHQVVRNREVRRDPLRMQWID